MSVDLVQYLNQYKFEFVIQSTNQKIEFRPITTGQMKHLLTYESEDDTDTIENLLDELIMGCVITEGFDVKTITIQDRFDLLLEIRKRSRGEVYSFIIKCPECRTRSINSVNLKELKVIPYPEKMDRMVKLSSDLTAEIGHLTRGEQEEIFKIVESLDISETKKGAEFTTYVYAMALRKFITPAGEVNDVTIEDKKKLVDSLDNETYEKLTQWFIKNDYGTVFKYQLKCENCDFKEDRDIPVTDFFV